MPIYWILSYDIIKCLNTRYFVHMVYCWKSFASEIRHRLHTFDSIGYVLYTHDDMPGIYAHCGHIEDCCECVENRKRGLVIELFDFIMSMDVSYLRLKRGFWILIANKMKEFEIDPYLSDFILHMRTQLALPIV